MENSKNISLGETKIDKLIEFKNCELSYNATYALIKKDNWETLYWLGISYGNSDKILRVILNNSKKSQDQQANTVPLTTESGDIQANVALTISSSIANSAIGIVIKERT